MLLCFFYYYSYIYYKIKKNKESNRVGGSIGLAFFEVHFEKLSFEKCVAKKKITTAKKICVSEKKV